jgi:predicted transposase/invertase (TIGR01784 family)
MRRLLDPKLDVVFKLLFADERNQRALISLLTAVLEPKQPITEVVVLNPEIRKEAVVSKATILDVRARISGGTQANIEMQTAGHRGFRKRALFYWARAYGSQMGRGEGYERLAPTHGIFICNFVELGTRRYHSIFRAHEVEEHHVLTDDFAIHFIELPKVPPEVPAAGDPLMLKWAKFFAAETDEELEQIAMTDRSLGEAKEALEQLSADPAARQLAEERELAAWNYRWTVQQAREEGEEKGRAEGEEKGRVEGEEKGRVDDRRDAVLELCRIFDIEITEERRSILANASLSELQGLHRAIAMHRRWPEGPP